MRQILESDQELVCFHSTYLAIPQTNNFSPIKLNNPEPKKTKSTKILQKIVSNLV